MSDDGARHPDIGARGSDRAIALAKQVATLVPGIGPVVAQLLLDDIPGQRMDRIADYIRLLSERIGALEFQAKIREPEVLDLFEEGALRATRALSVDRREQIAVLVAAGISGDDHKRVEAKRLLDLLSQIDDAQVVILASYIYKNQQDPTYFERHAVILDPAVASLDSSQSEREEATVAEYARDQLVRLGVLQELYPSLRKGEGPTFDQKTGRMKATGREITPLGFLLLRQIGLADDDDG